MIKLLITDIGGVLIKTDDAIIQCIETVFKQNNIPFGSKDDMLSAFGVSIYDYIVQYLPTKHKEKAGFCYGEFKKIYPDNALELMSVFPSTNETLTLIKKSELQVAVISCMIKKEVKANLSLLSFTDFDCIFSLDDYNDKRPHPNGLNMIMAQLGVSPAETAYIGDTVNDIRMAKNAGVMSIAVKTGAQENSLLEKENPDYLIGSFVDVSRIIKTERKNNS